MGRNSPGAATIASAWRLSREGDLRAASEMAAKALLASRSRSPRLCVELHLVSAFCAMRQGHPADAIRHLDEASEAASGQGGGAGLELRVEAWRAELAYIQGRYSAANAAIDRIVKPLERCADWAYVAFALRIRIATFLARTEYAAIAAISERALDAAQRSGDDYVLVQVLNILGAVSFDRATSKLAVPHARSHLASLDPDDAAAVSGDASEALRFFERAREVALRGGYEFAAWYVAGNIERLEILLGRADRAVPAIRKRLKRMQARCATYDEIVSRSNLAWGLRTLGRHREALRELDAALKLARDTGTFNVLLEFLHYDRSIVLDALGRNADARASYRRYVRLSGATRAATSTAPSKPPLEPFYLKRADRYIAEHIGEAIGMQTLAEHCGISWRTLQKAFADFRDVTPVAHVRNVRLDHASRALEAEGATVADVAARFGFGSPTTFALEYRKRFGTSPSHSKRNSQIRSRQAA